jgi:hypothetical protein
MFFVSWLQKGRFMVLLALMGLLATAKPIWIFGLGTGDPQEIKHMHALWLKATTSRKLPLEQTQWIAPLDGPRALQLEQEIIQHPENTYFLFFMGHGALNPTFHTLHAPHFFLTLPHGHNLSVLIRQLPSNVGLLTLIAKHAHLITESLHFGSPRKQLEILCLDDVSFSLEALERILENTAACHVPSTALSECLPSTHFMGFVPKAMDLRLECLDKVIFWVKTDGPASIRFSHQFRDFPPIVQTSDTLTPIYMSLDPCRHVVDCCHLKQINPTGSTRFIYRIQRDDENQTLVWPIGLR